MYSPPSQPITLSRDCDCIEIPSGAHSTLKSGSVVRILQSLGGSYTVSTNTGAMVRIDAKDADALGTTAPAATEPAPSAQLTEESVRAALKTVFDPEIPVNIVDLGLVYASSLTALPDGCSKIDVRMAMTAPGCGMANVLKADVEGKLSRLPGVKDVHVEVVFDPPWTPARMSDAAKLQLGLDTDYDAQDPSLRVL